MKYHPKHVEQLTDLNKLYSVASFWIIIAISFKTVYKSKVIMQGDSVARGPEILSIKNYVIEIMT